MERKYGALHVFRVYISIKGTDAGYTYDTVQHCADDEIERTINRLNNAGVRGVEITGCKDLGYRRNYVGCTLEYLIRIA